jgi:hypothetical protein
MATRHRELWEVGSPLIRCPDREILHLDALKTLLHRHGPQLTARHVLAGPFMLASVTLPCVDEA